MMIRSCQQLKNRKAVYTALAFVWALCATGAWAVSQRPMSTDEMIDASEQIFVAVCEGKSSGFRNGNIYTSYKLRPTDVWKGNLTTSEDGVIEMEELGGSAKGHVLANQMPGAPADAEAPDVGISQYVGGAANLIVGEEVLLFTVTGKVPTELARQGRSSPFKAGNLIIVGRNRGRFSILTDPASGEKFVTRLGVEGRGIVPSDASVRAFLNAQQRQVAGQASAAPAGSGQNPTRGVGLPVDEVLARLGAGDDAVSAAVQKGVAANAEARKRSSDALGALTGEIKDFDSLSKLKERVETRMREKAGK